jgi:two-component system CheB/CheR fusion protein
LTDRVQPDRELEVLLEYLKNSRAFDLTGYKRSTVLRRITKRMQQVEIDSFASYQDFLEVHPEEFAQLFDTVLINVTSFFRDAEAWTAIEREILPAILASNEASEPIRIWSAGCSSGEEAYSLAMLFAEKMGTEAFLRRVKIYATDVDDDAIARARQATYTAKDVEPVGEALLQRYFQKPGTGTFRAEVAGDHRPARPDPTRPSRASTSSRAATRSSISTRRRRRGSLARFHFALKNRGFLFLGKGAAPHHAHLFHAVGIKHRACSRRPSMQILRDRLLATVQGGDPHRGTAGQGHPLGEQAFSVAPVRSSWRTTAC